jgi:hypothetical protein
MNLDKILFTDVECYKNYFLIKFKKLSNGQVLFFEKFNEGEFNRQNVMHILNNYTIVTFNGNNYDQPVIEAACQGFSNKSLKAIGDAIIGPPGGRGLAPWQVRKQFGIGKMDIDHIDLIEVAPLTASLKIYGGRLNAKKLQDLPIEPDEEIQESDLEDMRTYCDNDNDLTELLFKALLPEIELRVLMSEEYGLDLRSKSDAQIAEAVIKGEMISKYGITPKKPSIKSGTVFNYIAPKNLSFETPQLKKLFEQYTSNPFTVASTGYMEFNFDMEESDKIKSGKNKGKFPPHKKQMKFVIGNTKYTAGIGGLHSCEKSVRHTDDGYILRDYDVASYYPRIILNNKLFPKHIGSFFLKIYNSIVERRLKAKKEGNKVVNESLKITINGSFGKLGSRWSVLYAPDLMMQVTVTGQLTLLMLIERLELAGISVVSANTDGIVVKMKPDQEAKAEEIVEEWQFDTDYELESTDYKSLNSRDVNAYIAVKEKSAKGKGMYADVSDHYYRLRTNPTNVICVDAVTSFLRSAIPIEETINNCREITKFTNIRTVNGGAVKEGKLIGKAIRWYYGAHELDAIYYKTSGNKVPKSEGAVPLMELPEKFPSDVDFPWYINEAKRMLKDIGYI